MSRLAVDPAVLAVAGVGLVGVGEGLVPAVAGVSAGYNANTGQDAAGLVFGRQYAQAGRGVMGAVATGINALLRTGYGVQVSAVNYSRAEALSDLSRRAQPLESPPCPVDVSPAGGPSPVGGGVAEPALWAVVELLVGDVWPNGSPTQMRVAAGAWRSFASVLYGVGGQVAGPYNAVAAQEIPEADSITATIRDIGGAFGQLAMACEGLATAMEGFAADVENTQNAIRRLLDRLGSIGSIVGMFFEFVRGHGEEELHQIAADIRTVMDHLKGEAAAKKSLMDQALRDFDALSAVVQAAADRQFREFFGEDVGEVLSGLWRAGGDIDRGVARWTASTVEGLEDLNPVRALYDPQGAWATWKGLAQMAQVVTNPAADPELTKQIGQGLLRVEEWKTQRPLTALTQNALDVGTLFLGPEAAAGGVAKAGDLADAARAAGRVDATTLTGALGKAGEATGAGGALDGISGRAAELTRTLDRTPAPPADRPPTVAAPATDKPPAAPVTDKPPVGGKPVSPDKPSSLPASPAESRPATAPTQPTSVDKAIATATDTPGSIPPGRTDHPVGGGLSAPDDATHAGHPVPDAQPALPPNDFRVGEYHPDAAGVAADLNDAFVNGRPTEALARQVADYSTHYAPGSSANRLVLGRWDGFDGGYIGEAVKNGGAYFDTGGDTWEAITKGLGESDAKHLAWEVNEQVLRIQLEKGVERIDYLLNHDEFPNLEAKVIADPRSFSAMEIRFLMRNAEAYGYRRVGDSWIYVEGGQK